MEESEECRLNINMKPEGKKKGRVYELRAPTMQERDDWVEVIKCLMGTNEAENMMSKSFAEPTSLKCRRKEIVK